MLSATLVLLNGKVYTLNREKPKAQAIAIFDKKIVYVGENSEASKLVGPQTKVIDLDRKTVLPGLLTDTFTWLVSEEASLRST